MSLTRRSLLALAGTSSASIILGATGYKIFSSIQKNRVTDNDNIGQPQISKNSPKREEEKSPRDLEFYVSNMHINDLPLIECGYSPIQGNAAWTYYSSIYPGKLITPRGDCSKLIDRGWRDVTVSIGYGENTLFFSYGFGTFIEEIKSSFFILAPKEAEIFKSFQFMIPRSDSKILYGIPQDNPPLAKALEYINESRELAGNHPPASIGTVLEKLLVPEGKKLPSTTSKKIPKELGVLDDYLSYSLPILHPSTGPIDIRFRKFFVVLNKSSTTRPLFLTADLSFNRPNGVVRLPNLIYEIPPRETIKTRLNH